MIIYFIYSQTHDAILDIGKGKLYSGYMTETKAQYYLDLYFKSPGHPVGEHWQYSGKTKFKHIKEDWEVVGMELQ